MPGHNRLVPRSLAAGEPCPVSSACSLWPALRNKGIRVATVLVAALSLSLGACKQSDSATSGVGIRTRIVPHQLRHTYASELVRAGIGLPALMKLLGHVNPEMTMRYVDVAGTDLQREFHWPDRNPGIWRPNRKP
jgi:hypothetical protein